MPDLWLPFTQDTRQQGLSNASVTTVGSGASINANGKLGKCYYLDGTSNGYIATDFPTNFGTNDFTISLWVKIPTISSGSYYAIVSSKQSAAISAGVGIYWNYTQKKFLWSTADGTNTTEIWMADAVDTIVYDKWIHLVMVRDNNDAKKGYFYINGTRYELASVPVIRNITTATNLWIGRCSSGNYPLKMYISDIKFWNGKVISPKENEILSRGMVCHYPLNGGGRGGDNLLKNTADLTLWTKETGITTTWDSEKNMYKIVDSAHTSSRWGIYQDINVSANITYTITCTLDGNSCGIGFGFYDSSIGFFPNAVITTSGTKKRESYTLTSGADSTICRIYLYTNCATSTTAWFSLPKLEVDSIATPWMPNPTDTEYTKMGYDSTTEYDVSGYQYNMDSHGSITYSSDTPKYSVCPYYQNTNMYLSATSPTSTIRTVSFWVKYTSTISDYRVAFGDYKSHLAFGMINSTSACVTCGGQSKDTFTIITPVANKWYHIVVKRASDSDSADVELYINGVKQTTRGNADNWNHNSDTLMIGRRATGSSVVGYMSDFRAYVTLLTEAQIKELYNTAVSVANNGTLMGYELVEV